MQKSFLKTVQNINKTSLRVVNLKNYKLEEFNTNSSFYKIYYYGNPKKLRLELLKFGFQLENVLGYWQIYLNE